MIFDDPEETKKGRRLLIVEDDPDLSGAIARLARSVESDLVVDIAVSTTKARELLEAQSYCLVLADYMLEGPEPGVGLFFDVRDRQEQARFIMMSSLEVPGIVGGPGEVPFRFVRKPFDAETFRGVLEGGLA